MNPPLYLLHLDRYHQGDPLFMKELAQSFARSAPGEPPVLLLHGSGEKLERTLEAQGRFPERRDGVLVPETDADRALAERAARESNQDLVALLTEEEVSAVGLQGADRGLLRVGGGADDGADGDASGEAGKDVRAGSLGWVADLIKMRVVPVVSALAKGPKHAVEVPSARAAAALAEALAGAFDVTPCVLATGPLPNAAPSALPEDVLPDAETTRALVEAHPRVLLTDLRSLFASDGPTGVSLSDPAEDAS